MKYSFEMTVFLKNMMLDYIAHNVCFYLIDIRY